MAVNMDGLVMTIRRRRSDGI